MANEEGDGVANKEGDNVTNEEGDDVANEEGDGVANEEGEGVANEEGDGAASEEGDDVSSEEGDGEEDDCPMCHVKGLTCQWICCDYCDTWFHTHCTEANPDCLLDIFFCSKCV